MYTKLYIGINYKYVFNLQKYKNHPNLVKVQYYFVATLFM